MNLSPSWKTYFDQLETNDVWNKSTSTLFGATETSDETSPEDILKTLTDDEDMVIMIVVPITNRIKLLHSIKNLGGTRLRPRDKIVGLDGFDGSATPVIIDGSSATRTLKIRVPAFNRIKAITSNEEISQLAAPSSGQVNFRHTQFSYVPPFLTTIFTDSDERDPAEMFITCRQAFEDFDNAYGNDPSYDKIYDNGKNILIFLWAATKGLVSPTIIIPANDDRDALKWTKNRHNYSIQNSLDNNSSTDTQSSQMFQNLAASIETQTQLFESIRQEKQEEKLEKQNKYLDLHDSAKLLILNASCEDGISCPIEPSGHCIEFYNKNNISKAMDYILSTLTHEYKCCVTMDTGLITALYSGHFLRDRDDSPSNFSFFLTPKKEPLSSNRLKPSIILQLKATQGKGWSDVDMKDALKQGISTPTDIHCFYHQLRNFLGLACFFFGDNCILSKKLTQFIDTLSQHTLTLEAAQYRDSLFATKLGYVVDTRAFRWLQQCQASKDRNEVNDNIIALDNIVDQVLTDSFFQILPMTFKQFNPTQDKDEPTPQRNKRQRTNQQAISEKVINPKPMKDWNVHPGDFQKYFAGKNLELRPFLDNRPMCTRFHSKFYCFSDCVNKITHQPSVDLDESVKKAYSTYMKKVKQQ